MIRTWAAIRPLQTVFPLLLETPWCAMRGAPLINGTLRRPSARLGGHAWFHAAWAAGWALGLAAGSARGAEPVDYLKQVKPLLARHCVECHGPAKQESGLRLDTAALAIRGGSRGPAVQAGKSGASLLVEALLHKDPDLAMPPEGPPLAAGEIALVRAWIDEGAKAPADEMAVAAQDPRRKHWAFQPLRRVPPPAVRNEAWPRSELDRFVLAPLEAAGLAPSGEADRSTLIRRLSLDLIGLPPTAEEVAAFLADKRSDAYERLVDRLLESPHFGERWARHWLDMARYADSNGFTIDSPRSIWKYRDWVIGAFNRNLPFDRFAIEQLAGDLLPQATLEQRVATGFHRNTLVNEEGGTDREQFRVESVVDRVNTTGAVFLGLTIGCAQCHDHKYDPLSQREYYQFYAFLNNADEPQIRVPSPEDERRLTEIRATISAVQEKMRAHDQRLAGLQAEWEAQILAQPEVVWQTLELGEASSASNGMFTRQPDKSLLVFSGAPAEDTLYVPAAAPAEPITAIRLEALTHNDLPNKGPGLSTRGLFVLSEFSLEAIEPAGEAKPGEEKKPAVRSVGLADAWADYAQPGAPATLAIDGKPKTGWAIDAPKGNPNQDRLAVFVLTAPLRVAAGGGLKFQFFHENSEPRQVVGRLRLSYTTAPAAAAAVPDAVRKLLAKPAAQRTKAEQAAIAEQFRASDQELKPLVAELKQAQARESEVLASLPTTLVMQEREQPRVTHVQIRGDFLRLGALVTPGVPEMLPPLGAAESRPNRLDLARWLVDPAQPLTPRVTVNRFWQQLFGTGLVETENDFGTRGDPPTHPELLDGLAAQFVDSGWDVKGLLRRITTSSVYRQSSAHRSDLAQADPRNRLLGRQNRLRLDAELVRDAALTASGLLARTIGGPSVFPPQANDLYRFTQNKKNWKDSVGADRFRRGMYTFFWRSSPHPFLMTFDAPQGNATCTRRIRSNTPLQALTLANDPAFIEIAQGLAGRMLAAEGDSESRCSAGFRACLARAPTADEVRILVAYQREQEAIYAAAPDLAQKFSPPNLPQGTSPAAGAAWTAAARVLLNLDEFITRE